MSSLPALGFDYAQPPGFSAAAESNEKGVPFLYVL